MRSDVSRFSFTVAFFMTAVLLLVISIMSERSSRDMESKVFFGTERLISLQRENFDNYFSQLDFFSLSPRNDTEFLKIVKGKDEDYPYTKFIMDLVKDMYYRREDISSYSIYIPSWNKGFGISRENRNIKELPFSEISTDPHFEAMKKPKYYKAVVPSEKEGELLIYYRTIINIESGKAIAYIKFAVDTSWLDQSWNDGILGDKAVLQDRSGRVFYTMGTENEEGKYLEVSSGNDEEDEDSNWRITTYISKRKLSAYSGRTRVIALVTGLSAIAVSVLLLAFFVRKNYIMELNWKNSQIKALEAQVNPHFLYNTLQTLSAEAIENRQMKINSMVMALSSMLKYSLKGEKVVLLRTELEKAGDYLYLQKARFGDRLTYEFDIAQEILEKRLPKMSVITLVENAIIHGMSPTSDSVRVEITAEEADGRLLVTVTDDGQGMSIERLESVRQSLDKDRGVTKENAEGQKAECMGLVNLSQRIKLMYGKNSGIEIYSTPFTGTSVVMELANV